MTKAFQMAAEKEVQMNNSRVQLERLKTEKSALDNEVKELEGRVDHFVQSLMKLLRLPGLVRDLETRMQTLEKKHNTNFVAGK